MSAKMGRARATRRFFWKNSGHTRAPDEHWTSSRRALATRRALDTHTYTRTQHTHTREKMANRDSQQLLASLSHSLVPLSLYPLSVSLSLSLSLSNSISLSLSLPLPLSLSLSLSISYCKEKKNGLNKIENMKKGNRELRQKNNDKEKRDWSVGRTARD